MQAFRRLFTEAVAYFTGSYLVNPQKLSDISRPPPDTSVRWSVPDVYSARLGLAYAMRGVRGLTLSFGGRIDGIPYHDLVGGNENGFRRPGYAVFVDPGLAIVHGRSTFTVTVPLRVAQQLADSATIRPGGKASPTYAAGDLASNLIFFVYSHRF